MRRLEGRHEATKDCRRDSQREENTDRYRFKRNRGYDTAKISGTEIGAYPAHRQLRECVPACQSEEAAGNADQRTLDHDQRSEPSARDAQDA